MSTELIVVCAAGAVVLLAFVALAIFISSPTHFQIFVFRTAISLAAAAAAAAIPGFVSLDLTWTGVAIRAGGALAVFVIVYRINPASLAIKDDPKARLEIQNLQEHFQKLERALTELADSASRDSKKGDTLASFLDGIANATEDLARAASKEPRDEVLFDRACGELVQFLAHTARWARHGENSEIDKRDVREAVERLEEARFHRSSIRVLQSPDAIKNRAQELSQIAGRLRALAKMRRAETTTEKS